MSESMVKSRKFDWIGAMALLFGAAVIVPSLISLVVSLVAVTGMLF